MQKIIGTTRQAQSLKIRKMITIAVFAAMAFVTTVLLHISVQFLTFDFKDVFITICGLVYGPIAALVTSVIVALIEFVSISDTGVYGLIMNFLSSAALSVTVSLIYKYKKTLLGAVCGLVSGVCAMTAVMMIANLLITPYFMHAPVKTVASMIPTLLLPFNLAKGVLNAAFVFMLYKPMSSVLQKLGAVEKHSVDNIGENKKYRFDGRTALVLVASLVIAVIAAVVIFGVLKGKISFFK